MGPFPLWNTKTLRGKKTLVPGSQERDAGRKTPAKKKFDLKKTWREKRLVYSWMCVSLLRNVHSQPDHDDITLLSPATFCFDFFFLYRPHSLLIAGVGPMGGAPRKAKPLEMCTRRVENAGPL